MLDWKVRGILEFGNMERNQIFQYFDRLEDTGIYSLALGRTTNTGLQLQDGAETAQTSVCLFCPLVSVLVLVLFSAHLKKFSNSRMQDSLSTNKPAAQAPGADPSRGNSTNR